MIKMYFLQEAIAAAPFLLIAGIIGVFMIIVIGYVLYTWSKREGERSRTGPVTFIIVVVLVILLLAGCGWLCGIKYG